MRVSVVCLASRSGGGLTILKDLFSYVSEHGRDHEWQFILSDQDLGPKPHNVHIVQAARPYRGKFSRLRGEFLDGRRAISKFRPDVVLSLQNVDTPARGKVPLAIYLHQALPFSNSYRFSLLNPDERSLAVRQRALKIPILRSIRRARVTFVQNKWLARELLDREPKRNIVPIGYNVPSNKFAVERQRVTGFFYPASGARYKGHRLLHEGIKKFRDTSDDGVLADITLTVSPESLEKVTGAESVSEIKWYNAVGQLSSVQMAEAYSKSILVYPSLIESLGLPLYEAMQAGIAIVASDAEYSREALQYYANVYWFKVGDVGSLASAMQDAWSNRDSVRPFERGQVGNTDNSWRTMIKELELALNDSVTGT